MSHISGDHRLLRAALLLDSMMEGAIGLACIVAAGSVAELLGLTQVNATLGLRIFGFALFAYGAALLWTSAQHQVSRRMTRLTIVLNLIWVVLSVVVVALDAFGLSETGKGVVLALAAVVGVLAAFQYARYWRLARD